MSGRAGQLLSQELAELDRLANYWLDKTIEFTAANQAAAAVEARARAVTYQHAHRRLEAVMQELDNLP